MARFARPISRTIDPLAAISRCRDPEGRSDLVRRDTAASWCLWIFTTLLLFASPAGADGWAYTYGNFRSESAASVQPRAGGGYVVAADAEVVGSSGSDFWLLELDAEGEVASQRAYGGEGDDHAAWAQQTGDGGYVIAGSTGSFGAEGGSDAWVVKLDDSGVIEWQKRYGGAASDSASYVEPVGEGYVVGGQTSSYGAGESDLWVLRLDAEGEVLWQKAYGGIADERFGSLRTTADGGFILAGSALSFINRNNDLWVVKLDAGGDIEWEYLFSLETAGNENSEWPGHIVPIETAQGAVTGYLVATTTAPWPSGNYGVWVLELDAAGQVVWQKLHEVGADRDVHSLRVVTGGYLIAGSIGGGIAGDYGWLMKIDADGDALWQHNYGGEDPDEYDSLSFAMENGSGNLIAAGVTHSFGIEAAEVWVLKLDAGGGLDGCLSIGDRTGVAAATEETGYATTATVTAIDAAAVTTEAVVAGASYYRENGCHLASLDWVALPRSGQVTRYARGDDGHLRPGVPWPSPRFVDNEDGTVTDQLTGLTWLTDGNCANTIGHDPDGTATGAMSWTSGMSFVAGINDGTHDISACASYSKAYEDWRAPNLNEMASLLNAEAVDSAAWLNEQGFTNAQSGWYFSSTAVMWIAALPQYNKWMVTLGLGVHLVQIGHYAGDRYMWPVREGQRDYADSEYPANVWKTGQTVSYYPRDDGALERGVLWPDERFTDHGDGTVTDKLTGLVWLKDANCFGAMLWQPALDTVADFNASPESHGCAEYTVSYRDWRLPARQELFSLFDRSIWNENVLPAGHPFLAVTSAYRHWTSTTEPSTASLAYRLDMGGFDGMERASKTVNPAEIWPVRGGPVPEPGAGATGLAAILTLVALRRRR